MKVDLGRTRSGIEDRGATKVLLVRHGECEAQVSEMDGPEGLDSSLSPQGLLQASAVAVALEPLRPTVILTSPMLRCVETAGAIAAEVAAPVAIWLDLREVLARRIHLPRAASMLSERAGCAIGGDPMGDDGWTHGDLGYTAAVDRAATVMARLRSEYEGVVVAVVTHGGFGSYLMCAALRLHDVWFQLDNASVTTLRWPTEPAAERPGWEMYPPVELEVLALNDVAHTWAGTAAPTDLPRSA